MTYVDSATINPSMGDNPSVSERVYLDFYNLHEVPFSITPDPEFLFFSETHRDAMEKIQYAIQSHMGFMLLTGEVGTGKTTLCRAILDKLRHQTDTVYIINPSLSGQELIGAILDDLGIQRSTGASKKVLIDQLNRFLLDLGRDRPVVIVIDDAQTMPVETLEDLRLLSNLETDKQKLLQILIVGQPELLSHLAQPALRQLKQRVAVHCCLDDLTRDEVNGYIQRRLFIAGNQGQVQFGPKVVARIHKQSKGIPRMINKICDLALTAAYAQNSARVELLHVKAALDELSFAKTSKSGLSPMTAWIKFGGRQPALAVIGVAAIIFLGIGILVLMPHMRVVKQAGPVIRIDAGTPATIEPGADVAPAVAVSKPGIEAGAYILQLGSFNTHETTMRARDIFSQKGIPAQWNAIDLKEKGIWYRVYTGRYATYQSARQYQEQMGLTSAKVLRAPWTLFLGPNDAAEDNSVVKALLRTDRLDSYAIVGPSGYEYAISGAYVSEKNAAAMARHIFEQTGLSVDIINCQPAIASEPSKIVNPSDGKLS